MTRDDFYTLSKQVLKKYVFFSEEPAELDALEESEVWMLDEYKEHISPLLKHVGMQSPPGRSPAPYAEFFCSVGDAQVQGHDTRVLVAGQLHGLRQPLRSQEDRQWLLLFIQHCQPGSSIVRHDLKHQSCQFSGLCCFFFQCREGTGNDNPGSGTVLR